MATMLTQNEVSKDEFSLFEMHVFVLCLSFVSIFFLLLFQEKNFVSILRSLRAVGDSLLKPELTGDHYMSQTQAQYGVEIGNKGKGSHSPPTTAETSPSRLQSLESGKASLVE